MSRCFNPYTPLFMLPQWIHTSGALAAIAVKAGVIDGGREGVRGWVKGSEGEGW